MPSNVVDNEKDEEKWQKAKRLAKEQGHEGEYDYIMGIYKKMDPDGIDKEAYVRGWTRTMKCAGLLDFDDDQKAGLTAGLLGQFAMVPGGQAVAQAPVGYVSRRAEGATKGDSEAFTRKAVSRRYPDIAEDVLSNADDRRLIGGAAMQDEILERAGLDGEGVPGSRHAYSPGKDKVIFDSTSEPSLPRSLHEAGHAKAFDGSEGWVRALRRHAAGGKGRLVGTLGGLGMATSENETVQDWAPAVALAGEAPELIEEGRANIEADRIMQNLVERGDMSPEALKRVRKALAAGMGKYVAGAAGIAGGVASVPWLKDKAQAYFED